MIIGSLLPLLLQKIPREMKFAGAIICSHGFVLLGFFSSFIPEISRQTVVIIPILIGLGYGMILLLWQDRLSRLSFIDATLVVVVALGCSSLCYLLVASLNELIQFLFPGIVILSLVLCLRAGKPTSNPSQIEGIFPPENLLFPIGRWKAIKNSFSVVSEPLLCASVAAFAGVFTRSAAFGTGDRDAINLLECLCVLIVAVILVVVWFLIDKSRRDFLAHRIVTLAYRASLPVIATAVLLLCIFGSVLGLFVAGLTSGIILIISVFIMLTAYAQTSKDRLWPPCLFGLLSALIYFIQAVATPIAFVVSSPGSMNNTIFFVIAVVVIYALSLPNLITMMRTRRKSSRESSGANSEAFANASTAFSNSPLLTTDASDSANEESLKPSATLTLEQRCVQLGKAAGLTAREIEIMEYVARGRDVPSIAKSLVISENTIRSHMKHFYQKLDIHSKQELIDLMEDAE